MRPVSIAVADGIGVMAAVSVKSIVCKSVKRVTPFSDFYKDGTFVIVRCAGFIDKEIVSNVGC